MNSATRKDARDAAELSSVAGRVATDGFQDSRMDDSESEQSMPSSDRQTYHSRCFWLGKVLCTAYLAESIFHDATQSKTGMELEAELLGAFAEFPYSDCIEKIDALKTVDVESNGDAIKSDLMLTFLTKFGIIMDQGNNAIRQKLCNLIYSRGVSTTTAKERLLHGQISPPLSTDEDMLDEKPLAMYTMRLSEWCQQKQKSINYKADLLSLEPPRWQMTASVDGMTFSGAAKKQQSAKHIASKNACLGLGVEL
ncbi:hypothetical protein AC578_10097 [Pseudocercospora eumusae]|uniref:DRBM domain-containing protein n=1 Tax=Pseudocercospora eumusae TaxID=321146 RepID=A0A139GVN5_9PEZI|nr:hypothetical protein AC578_10097 [Pseudocercospora eumusae]